MTKPIDMTNYASFKRDGVDYSIALRDMLPALIAHQAMSKQEISKATGRGRPAINRLFDKLHAAKPKQIYIAGWRRGESGRLSALWQLGNGTDAPMPPPMTGAEKQRRYRNTEAGREKEKAASARWKRSEAAADYHARQNARRNERTAAKRRAKKTAQAAVAQIDPLLAAIMRRAI